MIRVPNPPARGEEILSWAVALTNAVRRLVPADSSDILVNRGGTSVTYSLRRRRGGVSGAPLHVPFGVSFTGYTTGGGGEVTAVNVIVELDSWLMKTEDWNDRITITGLGSSFAVTADEKVWLEITMDPNGGPITSATIEHGETGEGGEWESFPSPIEYDSEDETTRSQIKYRHLLAEFVEPDDWGDYPWQKLTFPGGEERLLRSTTASNLIVCRKCYEPGGLTVRVLAPWFAPSLSAT